MKNSFYFNLKALLDLKICYLLSSILKLTSKFLTWLTSNCNTRIEQYLKSKDNQAVKFGQLIEYNMKQFS